MKKLIVLALLVLLSSNCSGFKETEKPAIKIGKIQISSQRFQREFELSGFAKEGKKKDFLETFVSRKLILLEAEKLGLDKDPKFLHDVQNFWEQSLLKIVVDRKTREVSREVMVTEQEVQDYYNSWVEKNPDDSKTLDELRPTIKWVLSKERQTSAISSWIEQLKQNADIKIDKKALGIE